MSLNEYESFSRTSYNFNHIKATDNFDKFKDLVNVLEHHVFHKNHVSKLSAIVSKICPLGKIPIGRRMFRFTCKYCEKKSDVEIIDIYKFNVDKFEKLVSALVEDNNKNSTNVLYNCGILGREGWEFLPIYLLIYRLDILFSIPLTSNLRINGIIHMIAAHIYKNHENEIPIQSTIDRENQLVAKFGRNNVSLALICIKMFGVFPLIDDKLMRKFSINVLEEFYYMIPSLSLPSIKELLSTFNSVPVGEDHVEYATTTKQLIDNDNYENSLNIVAIIKHLPLIQKCSREFIYYFALNTNIFNDYSRSPISHENLFDFQTYSIEKINRLSFPIVAHTHDKNLSATGELVFSDFIKCRNKDGNMILDYYSMAQKRHPTATKFKLSSQNNR